MESSVILLKSLFLASFVLVLASCELNETESCSAGEARLVNGTSDKDGALEICKDDESSWGTVCSTNFDCNDAKVGCRQLGYNYVFSYYTNTTGIAERPSFGGGYACSGSENALVNCSQSSYYSYYLNHYYYCSKYKVAGLRCGELPETNCDTEGTIRLVGGSKKSEGHLQMCRGLRWRDVCSSTYYRYYQSLGTVVCKELGYASRWISTSLHRHYYNSSVQPPLYTQLTCYSNYYTNASFCNIYDECINCSGSEVAIKCEFEQTDCKNGSVRLVGGTTISEGWVEICVDGIWGRIVNNIEGKTKEFACEALGYSNIGATVVSSSAYEKRNTPIVISYINCCEHDESFQDCDFEYAETNYYVRDYQILGLRCFDGCTHGSMRLTGGETEHEGIVELCVSGTWRYVGNNNWDDTDANVVCQHLSDDTKYSYASVMNSSDFEQTSRLVTYDYVNCNGAETSIYNCYRQYVSSPYTGAIAAVQCHLQCDCGKRKRDVEWEVEDIIQERDFHDDTDNITDEDDHSNNEDSGSHGNEAVLSVVIISFVGGSVFGILTVLAILVVINFVAKKKEAKLFVHQKLSSGSNDN